MYLGLNNSDVTNAIGVSSDNLVGEISETPDQTVVMVQEPGTVATESQDVAAPAMEPFEVFMGQSQTDTTEQVVKALTAVNNSTQNTLSDPEKIALNKILANKNGANFARDAVMFVSAYKGKLGSLQISDQEMRTLRKMMAYADRQAKQRQTPTPRASTNVQLDKLHPGLATPKPIYVTGMQLDNLHLAAGVDADFVLRTHPEGHSNDYQIIKYDTSKIENLDGPEPSENAPVDKEEVAVVKALPIVRTNLSGAPGKTETFTIKQTKKMNTGNALNHGLELKPH